jgi:hypothetical protein
MALWKNKKIRIGGLRAGLFFTQAFDGEGSMAFTGPRPHLRLGAGDPEMASPFRFCFEFRIQGLENLAVLSDLAGFFVSLFPSIANAFSLSLSRSLSLPLWFFVVCSSTRTVRDDKKRERFEYG